jgi:hypothetical protein
MIPWRFQKWVFVLAGTLGAIGLAAYALEAVLGRHVTIFGVFGSLFVVAASVMIIAAKGWNDA